MGQYVGGWQYCVEALSHSDHSVHSDFKCADFEHSKFNIIGKENLRKCQKYAQKVGFDSTSARTEMCIAILLHCEHSCAQCVLLWHWPPLVWWCDGVCDSDQYWCWREVVITAQPSVEAAPHCLHCTSTRSGLTGQMAHYYICQQYLSRTHTQSHCLHVTHTLCHMDIHIQVALCLYQPYQQRFWIQINSTTQYLHHHICYIIKISATCQHEDEDIGVFENDWSLFKC